MVLPRSEFMLQNALKLSVFVDGRLIVAVAPGISVHEAVQRVKILFCFASAINHSTA